MSSRNFSTPVSLPPHRSKHLTSEQKRTPPTVAKVAENDDEAERLERRKRRLGNNLATLLSPGCNTPGSATRSTSNKKRTAESATCPLLNAQLTEHYAKCIKLSSQNKITAKNAFGLNLIDHMLQMLTIQGEMTNFQIASSTLDASAKIYAGRVDSIYTDALKVLTGFGRDNQGAQDEEPAADSEKDDEPTKTKTKKSTGAVSKVIEKHVTNLDVQNLELEYQTDPLFMKTSAAFDEGGVDGLLINHLSTEPGQLLSLNANQVPSHSDHPSTNSVDITAADMMSLEILSTAQVSNRMLCSTLNDVFEQDNWSLETASASIGQQLDSQSLSTIGFEYSLLPCPPPSTTLLADEGPTFDEGVATQPDDIHDLTVLANEPQVANYIPSVAQASNELEGHGPLGNLVLTEAIEQSDYSYFAPSILDVWAGPKHWKIKPRAAFDKETKPKKKREPLALIQIDFTATVDESNFSPAKTSTQFSKAVLSKRSRESTTLPHNPRTNPSLLHKLFSIPKLEVKRSRGKTEDVDDEPEGDWYNYGNANDVSNYCPQVESLQTLGGCDNDAPSMEGDMGFPLTQEPSNADYTGLLLHNSGMLLPEPRKIPQTHVGYAKAAKRVDMKKLKTEMWNWIAPDKTTSEEMSCERNFSEMCQELPSKLTNEMRKNISIPIYFASLLHLANEKCLSIKSVKDFSELVIAQDTPYAQ